MSVDKFWNAGIFYAGINYTGQSNKVALERRVSMLDTSVFGVDGRVNACGQDEVSAKVSGWWYQSDAVGTQAPDPNLFNGMTAGLGDAFLVYPSDADLGIAYFFPGVMSSYNYFGAFGELAPFDMAVNFAQWGGGGTRVHSYRGVIGLQLAARAGANGNGSYVQYNPAPSSSDVVGLTVQLISTDATNVTFNLQSAATSGFAGPTTRVTSGAMTAGGQSFIGEAQGPITDQFYRIAWTRTGGTTFTAVAAFGKMLL